MKTTICRTTTAKVFSHLAEEELFFEYLSLYFGRTKDIDYSIKEAVQAVSSIEENAGQRLLPSEENLFFSEGEVSTQINFNSTRYGWIEMVVDINDHWNCTIKNDNPAFVWWLEKNATRRSDGSSNRG